MRESKKKMTMKSTFCVNSGVECHGKKGEGERIHDCEEFFAAIHLLFKKLKKENFLHRPCNTYAYLLTSYSLFWYSLINMCVFYVCLLVAEGTLQKCPVTVASRA